MRKFHLRSAINFHLRPLGHKEAFVYHRIERLICEKQAQGLLIQSIPWREFQSELTNEKMT